MKMLISYKILRFICCFYETHNNININIGFMDCVRSELTMNWKLFIFYVI